MYTDVLIAGFGGQGIIFAGKLLAYAGLGEEREVVFYPSYGAEMRGGTANCTVIISNSMIPSPIISCPGGGILMSYPAAEKFLPQIKKESPVVINSSLVGKKFKKEGLRILEVPANSIAEKMGNVRAANMVALGAWAYLSGAVCVDTLICSLKKVLSPDKFDLLSINENSLREGWRFASNPN